MNPNAQNNQQKALAESYNQCGIGRRGPQSQRALKEKCVADKKDCLGRIIFKVS